MRLKELECELQQVQGFETPKYITSPHIAAHLLFNAATMHDDIIGKNVLDLGCGTGMLGIGSFMLGCDSVTGVDIDRDALDICQENIDDLEIDMDLIQCDIRDFSRNLKKRELDQGRLYDTVIMNPPFGTKVKGLDIEFLTAASTIADTIWSLHKTTTRDFVIKKGMALGFKVNVIAELRYDLPKTYVFHKKDSKDIQVDVVRFEKLEIKEWKK